MKKVVVEKLMWIIAHFLSTSDSKRDKLKLTNQPSLDLVE